MGGRRKWKATRTTVTASYPSRIIKTEEGKGKEKGRDFFYNHNLIYEANKQGYSYEIFRDNTVTWHKKEDGTFYQKEENGNKWVMWYDEGGKFHQREIQPDEESWFLDIDIPR